VPRMSTNFHNLSFPLLAAIVLALTFSPASRAQTAAPTVPSDQLGEQPYQTYHGGDIDSVNLSTGTLSINLSRFSLIPSAAISHYLFT
jgi:hypothetical protein